MSGDDDIVNGLPKREIAIILTSIINVLSKDDIQTNIHSRNNAAERLIYLMDVIQQSITVSSHLYKLYNLWLKNIIQNKNIEKVIEDITEILTLFKRNI